MNFRIVENAPDGFDEIYPQIKELLNTTSLSFCEISKRFGINCNNNTMYRKIVKTYEKEMGFNLRTRKIRITKGEWL